MNTPLLPRRAVLAALAAATLPAAAQAPQPLVLGLAPFLSTTALLAAFRRLREHLERDLAGPVATYTARDFRTLCENARRGDYDIALLPAHVGLLALQDWGFAPIARTLPVTTTLLLVRHDSRVRTAADLQGGRVGGLDPLSIIVASALAWLQSQGLAPGRDMTFVPQASINSGLFALARGDIEVMVVASSQLLLLPADTPRPERVLKSLGDVAGPVFVARPGPSGATLDRWRAAFGAFKPDPAGPATAANTPLAPLAAADLAPLSHYTALARVLLASGR